MKLTQYLIINAQTGECRLRKSPAAGPMDYCFKLAIQTPDHPIPTIEIKIPVPNAPAILTEFKQIQFGIPWAVSEDIIKVNGIDNEGVVIWDYTDKGLAKLKTESGETGIFEALEWARKNWGIPIIILSKEQADKHFPREEK